MDGPGVLMAPRVSWWAETLARVISPEPSLPITSFPVNEDVVRDVLRLIAASGHLYFLQAVSMNSAKGVRHSIKSTTPIPEDLRTPRQDAALKLFDKRALNDKNLFSTIGLNVSWSEEVPPNDWGLLLCFPSRPPDPERHSAEVRRFGVMVYPLRSPAGDLLRDFHAAGIRFDVDFVNILMLLLVLRHTGGEHNPHLQGCFALKREAFEALIGENFEQMRFAATDLLGSDNVPTTPEEFFTNLLNVKTSPWPLRGGTSILALPGYYFLDLLSTTRAFFSGFEALDAQPGAAHASRGPMFENTIRTMIDRTAWKPDPQLRRLVGLTLRLKGQALTDIDAIAHKDRILLAISCKSVLFTPRYWDGSPEAVRNRRTDLLEDVLWWQERMRKVDETRQGDNYDLQSVAEIVPVVVTPAPVYTEDEIPLEFVRAGLRRSVSAWELEEWLSAN
jgi:hypothetical protein